MEEEQHHDYGGGVSSNNNNIGDLRRFFSPIPMTPVPYHPPPPPPQQTLFSTGTGGAFTPLHYPHQQYEMMLVMGGGRSHVPDNVLQVDFHSDSTTTTSTTAGTAPTATITVPAGVGYDGGIALGDGGGSTVRWPRQETLTLLEVRSVLDHKFKEANHKGPLWDEVSRIMSEEHGYQRSGKKCREKFENLYKYYKKTKGGKAGRQDGKHYRFFRQLEALYGEPAQNHTSIHHQFNSGMNTATTNISHYDQEDCFRSISLSNTSSSDLNTSSSDDVKDLNRAKKREKRSWKSKIKGFIDLQMRKIMEKQEAWLEKMMRTLEHKEKERMLREEEWRSRESERIEREHKLWAEERSWIEARDRSLTDNLAKLTGKELAVEEKDLSSSNHSDELLTMTAFHQRQLHQSKVREDRDDQDIEKRVNNSKKRKENWRIESGDGSNSSHHLCSYGEIDLGGSGGHNPMNDSFKFLLGNEGDSHMLGSYGVKLNKGN